MVRIKINSDNIMLGKDSYYFSEFDTVVSLDNKILLVKNSKRVTSFYVNNGKQTKRELNKAIRIWKESNKKLYTHKIKKINSTSIIVGKISDDNDLEEIFFFDLKNSIIKNDCTYVNYNKNNRNNVIRISSTAGIILKNNIHNNWKNNIVSSVILTKDSILIPPFDYNINLKLIIDIKINKNIIQIQYYGDKDITFHQYVKFENNKLANQMKADILDKKQLLLKESSEMKKNISDKKYYIATYQKNIKPYTVENQIFISYTKIDIIDFLYNRNMTLLNLIEIEGVGNNSLFITDLTKL